MSLDKLFEPLSFTHGPAMKNRFMLAPLTNCQSHPDGRLSDEEFHWLTKRAEGGFGLTMTCAAHVQARGQGFPGQLGIFGDEHIEGLTRLASAIKAKGSIAAVQALVRNERDAFYAGERVHRERARTAPFGRLAALVLSSHDGDAVRESGRMIAKAAPAARGVTVWGPAPAFYAVLRGQTRERLLVQADRGVDVQAYLRAWLAAVKLPNSVRLSVDVDPVSFF